MICISICILIYYEDHTWQGVGTQRESILFPLSSILNLMFDLVLILLYTAIKYDFFLDLKTVYSFYIAICFLDTFV